MAFSENTVAEAFRFAGGQCQCLLLRCSHLGRCSKKFKFEDRELSHGQGWRANHKQAVEDGGSDEVGNCEILCVPCHKNIPSFGKS